MYRVNEIKISLKEIKALREESLKSIAKYQKKPEEKSREDFEEKFKKIFEAKLRKKLRKKLEVKLREKLHIKNSKTGEQDLLDSKECKSVKSNVKEFKIAGESVDARDKRNIKIVYTLDFSVSDELADKLKRANIKKAPDLTYKYPYAAKVRSLDCDKSDGDTDAGVIAEQRKSSFDPPVIVGFGPCGMFAAYILSELGYAPIVLERGSDMETRTAQVEEFWSNGRLDTESNVQFGEGGAGTFSDGKLTTGTKDPRNRKVLETFVSAGADSSILYKHKPHIGTDVLRKIVVNLRKEIIKNGGKIFFDTKMTDLIIDDGKVAGVEVECKDGSLCRADKEACRTAAREIINTQNVILAIGHSARDTFRMIDKHGIKMEQKPFSIGVRIEHPQELINEAQYGDAGLAEILGAADYKLSHRCENGRGVYTFCMCPGGEVVTASSQEGGVVTNGMSYSDRAGKYANSGLLVDVRTDDFGSDDPLAGVIFQEKYERLAFANGGGNYRPPKTTWGAFDKGEEAAKPVMDSIPGFAAEAMREAMPYMARKLRGFDSPKALLTAVESRSSSPVRITRNEDFAAEIEGLYPAGEGAGYAGGIMSAAVDGIKVAEKIAGRIVGKSVKNPAER